LVAIDGLRVNDTSLKKQLGRKRPGDRVSVHAFRREELLTIDIELEAPRPELVTLRTLKTGPGVDGGVEHTALQKQDRRGLQAEQERRSAWLGNSPLVPAH
jgi:predicted metalloprotease with PDZ domain